MKTTLALILLSVLILSVSGSDFKMHRHERKHKPRHIVSDRLRNAKQAIEEDLYRGNPAKGVNLDNLGVDSGVKGIEGAILGLAYGLQYNKQRKGMCLESLETSFELLRSLWTALTLSYLPSYWANVMQTTVNINVLYANLYGDCQI